MVRAKLFLDLETTGLDPDLHEAWEIAWAFDLEPVQSSFLPHGGRVRDREADVVNHYLERCPAMVKGWLRGVKSEAESRLLDRVRMLQPTIVSASPSAVDVPFLRARWRETPWHHRVIDISTYAMPILGHAEPQGQWQIASELREAGFDVPLPDHSAGADVESLRACYYLLEALARGQRRTKEDRA